MSFDLASLDPTEGPYVRSDACVVPALAVVAEAVACWEILSAMLEKLGGDTIEETIAARERVVAGIHERLRLRRRPSTER
jgi:chorismate synthase